ncbi:hypothetical protein SAMN05421753_11278 [Planctomicrobium piriforme]|uniref:Uncharacterized protein n=2 Tax=Planctomicrobium piriforme TaxID=1576369 RepID=A0A1I3KXX6_9PLAN|nr:hypothetical protein SAMN05421753_11278 [Planctomicrobium piriforme]
MPPAKNAADLYLVGLADFNPELKWVFPESEQAAQEKRSQKLVDRLNSVIAEIVVNPSLPLPTDAYELLIDTAPAVKIIDRAQEVPDCLFLTGMEPNFKLVHAQAANNLSIRARIELIQAVTPFDFTQAERTLLRYLRLSRDLRPRGCAIVQLVAILLENSVWNELEKHVLPSQQLTSEQCDRLLSIINQHQQTALKFEAEACRVEYIELGNTFDGLKSGRIKTEDLDLDWLARSRINHEMEWSTASRLTKKRLSLIGLPLHEAIQLETAAAEYDSIRDEDVEPNLLSRLVGDKLNHPVVCLFQTASFGEFLEGVCRVRIRLGAMKCVIAIRRYEINHGQWPVDLLPALREAGINSVPIDEYCGEPLRYRIIDGKPVLYSVGRDKKDDGGFVDWKYGEQPGDMIFGIVTPAAKM